MRVGEGRRDVSAAAYVRRASESSARLGAAGQRGRFLVGAWRLRGTFVL